MQLRQVNISHFRGIRSLNWKPGVPFCCLIGPGDSGKSSVLDAVEAVLSSRWLMFTESDFLACDTTRSIIIEATVGELSKALKSDERFGLYVRGWTSSGELRDEPEDDDEAVLTVRLTVDASLEPSWELICNRFDEPRTLSNRDRTLFGLVRLAGEDARHLAWGQGSVLTRLTGDTHEATARLAQAYKAARENANLGKIQSLANAAEKAEDFAKGLGAYVEGSYEPGLELGRAGLNFSSIALHDEGVPLRLAGLGTRRLATLAIQRSAISEGAIVLIDEIEHGLEPHRIIGVIAQLKADQNISATAKRSVGQVLMTTHSDVAIGETGPECLRVIQLTRPVRLASIFAPTVPDSIRALMRFNPRALFARRILVTEGYTEIGLLLGIRENWPQRHAGKPIEQLGVAIADGNGSQAPAMALALHELGYQIAIFRDSDTQIDPIDKELLTASGIKVFEYRDELNTEQAIFSAASDELVQELLNFAREEKGKGFVNNNLAAKFTDLSVQNIQDNFSQWQNFSKLSGEELRLVIANVAAGKDSKDKKDKKTWFKDQRIGRMLAPLVWRIAEDNPASALAIALHQVEEWLYA